MQLLGEIQDEDGIPAFLYEDVATGRLSVMFNGDMLLPVQRGQFDAFMAWHWLQLRGEAT